MSRVAGDAYLAEGKNDDDTTRAARAWASAAPAPRHMRA